MKKLPPIEKVYEAWTAIADKRVEMGEGEATVESSDGAKEYTVKFQGDNYSSTDNATFWQGYPGYPVLAVMMLQGKLPLALDEAYEWKGVNWKEINTKYRNDYAKAVAEVAESRNIDKMKANDAARKVMDTLEKMTIQIKRKI